MYVKKEFKFEMAHRLTTSYTEACQRLHGHSYKVVFHLNCDKLNDDGMVIDFKEIKDLLSPFFNMFDHSLVLHFEDKDLSRFARMMKYIHFHRILDSPTERLKGIELIIFPENPTAENMANLFLDICYEILKSNLTLPFNKGTAQIAISVFETSTSEAISDWRYLL